jgi:hypothetical protein
MALITRMLRYTLAAACLSLVSLPGEAAVYKCVDRSGGVTYSERPCNGGEEITVEAPCPSVDESAIDERLQRARKQSGKVKQRLEIERIERELSRLESRRQGLIKERDKELADLSSRGSAAGWSERQFWTLKILAVGKSYADKIDALEKQVLDLRLAAGKLRIESDGEQFRPKGRMLGLDTQGKCLLFIEGEATAESVRVHAEGFEPGELVETIGQSGDVVTRNMVVISKDGCLEGVVLPRVSGKSGGDAKFTIKGSKCELKVTYQWRLP